MAWEQGLHGQPYYTRTIRCGDRRVREYLGHGPAAVAAAAADTERRRQRQAQAEQRRLQEEQSCEADRLLRRLFILTDLILSAVLASASYHYYSGEWRRRRDG
jgi:hypothetical protein